MKTYIYNAKSKEPLAALNFGIGDIISLKSYGGIYPSYTQAYEVFGKTRPDGRCIEHNVFRVIGFIMHSSYDSRLLAAVGNDEQFFIVDINNIKPYCSWSNSIYNGKCDVIYVNNVDDLTETDRISNEDLKSEFDKIISASNGQQL